MMLEQTTLLPVQPTYTIADYERLQARIERLLALQKVAADLASQVELKPVLREIVHAALSRADCDECSLLLLDPATNGLVLAAWEGEDGSQSGSVLSGRLDSDRASTIVPLIADGMQIGVLEAARKAPGGGFSAEDEEFFVALASQGAIAIQHARLYERLVVVRDQSAWQEEAVRREVARNLHDGPAQILTALIMSVRFLKEALERAPERAGDELPQLEALGQKALSQVRNILFELQPAVLESDGIGPALEAYVERLKLVEPRNIEIVLDNVHSRFEPTVESSVFAIVREAVSNARRHADARRIRIEAAEAGGALSIEVRDDGCGFDPASVENESAPRPGFGLPTMRRRAQAARADLCISSSPGRGTSVHLRVPVTASPVPDKALAR
jgi:signal transduction histidine kinase